MADPSNGGGSTQPASPPAPRRIGASPGVPLPGYFFEQYKMLAEFARFEHTRWTDNYKIFLTVAGAILAGEGALITTDKDVAVRIFMSCLAGLGLIVGGITKAFVRRPHDSANVWYFYLRDFEAAADDLVAPVFTRANDALRVKGTAPGYFVPAGDPVTAKKYRLDSLTTRGLVLVYAFMGFQLVMLGVSAWPWLCRACPAPSAVVQQATTTTTTLPSPGTGTGT